VVFVRIIREDGVQGKLFCSVPVSDSIRNGELDDEEFLGLRVIKDKTKDGNDTLKIVGWESDGKEIVVKSLATKQASSGKVVTVAKMEDLGI
jgi:hypothetical protein